MCGGIYLFLKQIPTAPLNIKNLCTGVASLRVMGTRQNAYSCSDILSLL